MAPRYKDKDGGVVLAFNGQWVSWSHTVVAYSMFELPAGCAVPGIVTHLIC